MNTTLAGRASAPVKSHDLSLCALLQLYGFDPSVPWRVVRHQDKRYPIEQVREESLFELYQAYQRGPVYGDAKQLISFHGLPGTRARFYGVYRVRGIGPSSGGGVVKGSEWSERWRHDAKVFYDLEPDPRFDHLQDRLIIEWGRGALAWIQRSDKAVIEVKAPGRSLPPFEDYLEFSLTHAQLVALFQNEDAHDDWRSRLTAVGGVYLILAEGSGELYIGSASGAEGIWGRWRQYAADGHGDNRLLRDLTGRNRAYPGGFRYSVLQIVPKTMAKDVIIEHEQRFKTKLGSRAHGLNGN